MRISLTQLRSNLYKIVDQVIETGMPVEIERKGKILKILPDSKLSKLQHLQQHPHVINGNPDDIIDIDWLKEWREDENI
jgi:hypothetical protein